MAGGHLAHIGASMHEESVALSPKEIQEKKAATPKRRKTLEEEVRFEGGTVSMRGHAQSSRRERQATMLRLEREQNRSEEEQLSAEEEARLLENEAWGEELDKDDGRLTMGALRPTHVTYRPSRKPGDGPNIRSDAATYSKLINVKKYATFRKNMEKHEIHKKSGNRVGNRVDKKKGLERVLVDAQKATARDSPLRLS